MLASDLFGATVLDPDGRSAGTVLDIRVRPRDDGERLGVEGLVVGRRSIRLFGYERGEEVGPGLFVRVAARLHRDTRFARLRDVDLDQPGAVRLRVPWRELPNLPAGRSE